MGMLIKSRFLVDVWWFFWSVVNRSGRIENCGFIMDMSIMIILVSERESWLSITHVVYFFAVSLCCLQWRHRCITRSVNLTSDCQMTWNPNLSGDSTSELFHCDTINYYCSGKRVTCHRDHWKSLCRQLYPSISVVRYVFFAEIGLFLNSFILILISQWRVRLSAIATPLSQYGRDPYSQTQVE